MTPYYADEAVTLHHGDSLAVLRQLSDASIDCCVTSPPYFGLRDYGSEGQYGLEASPAEYVETMRQVFGEVRRVLADDGTLWLNLGDSYSSNSGAANNNLAGWAAANASGGGHANAKAKPTKGRPRVAGYAPKNLLGIPWRVAFALQDDGWILRNDIIWAKSSGMPESVTDRLARRHEHLFLLTKGPRYWFDLDAVREPHARTPTKASAGKNPGDVWTIAAQPFGEAHFAVMPQALAERAVLAGCKPGGTVLDPFSGSGTTGLVATNLGRKYVGIELSADYLDLSLRTRFAQPGLGFSETA